MTENTYEITATLTVDVTNPAAVHNIAIMSGADRGSDAGQDLEAAVAAGLNELPALVQRYGFRVVESTARVVAKARP